MQAKSRTISNQSIGRKEENSVVEVVGIRAFG